jgi:hypothetical protein
MLTAFQPGQVVHDLGDRPPGHPGFPGIHGPDGLGKMGAERALFEIAERPERQRVEGSRLGDAVGEEEDPSPGTPAADHQEQGRAVGIEQPHVEQQDARLELLRGGRRVQAACRLPDHPDSSLGLEEAPAGRARRLAPIGNHNADGCHGGYVFALLGFEDDRTLAPTRSGGPADRECSSTNRARGRRPEMPSFLKRAVM